MPETLGVIQEVILNPAAPRWGRARLMVDGQVGTTLHLDCARRLVLRLMVDVGEDGDFALDGRVHLAAQWAGPNLPGLDDRMLDVPVERLWRGGEVARWTLDLDTEVQAGERTLHLSVGDEKALPALGLHVLVGEVPQAAAAVLPPPVVVDLEPEGNDQVVRLLVEPAEHGGRVRIWARCAGHDDFKDSVPRPSKVYVDTEELTRARSFVAGILQWSQRSGALVRWLKESLAEQVDPVVLIEDEVPSGEPFELLFFDTEMKATLGTEARVVRWNTIETIERELTFKVERATDPGLALCVVEVDVDPDGVERTAASVLGSLEEGGLAGLLEALANADPAPALVHIASHATWTVDEAHGRGLGATDDGAQLTEIDFVLAASPKAPTAIFANACHSGRLALDDSLELTGLPLTLLDQHAWLFVGTLGRMSGAVAAEVGAHFLSQAGSAEGVDPAAFFRDLRRQWLDELRRARETKQGLDEGLGAAYRRHLHAGLYVVYGPARARVKVVNGG